MSINTIYQLFLYIIKKDQSADLSPDEFNRIWNLAQINYVDYLLGEFQQYQYGRAVAKVEIGQNQTVLQRLAPLIDTPTPLTINGTTGQANYPAGYLQAVTMYTSSMSRVRYVQQNALYSYLESVIDPIATNPVYLIENGKFQFYPVTLGTALLSYVKTPPDAHYAFILDGDGNPVFDPGNSIDPVFEDLDIWAISAKALAMVGTNLQAPMIAGYANNINTQGS